MSKNFLIFKFSNFLTINLYSWKEVYSNITVVLPGIKTPFRASKIFVKTPIADAANFYAEDYALIYLPTMVLPTTPPPKSKSFL